MFVGIATGKAMIDVYYELEMPLWMKMVHMLTQLVVGCILVMCIKHIL